MISKAGPEAHLLGPWIAPEDELVCLGHDEDLEAQSGALAPPIVQTSLFAQPSFDQLVSSLDDEYRARVYSRGNNPTVQAVELKIAALEGGESCRCLGSGMAAVNMVLTGALRSGDHIVFAGQTYGPTINFARRLERFGIDHVVVPKVTPERVASALRDNTRVLWMESPSTMVFETFDVAALVQLAKDRGETDGRSVLTALDNSWASPLFQKPLASGVDFVVHSATKYIGGHSDVVAGAVVGSHALMEPLFHNAFLLGGAALGPMDAWLLNRGLRTLPTRMRQHHHGGFEVAQFLAQCEHVRTVMHPGLTAQLKSHAEDPQGLAGCSGLFSFELALDGKDRDHDYDRLNAFMNALRRFRIGVSWGGVESLALAPARRGKAEALEAQGVAYGTVRLSIGLEPPAVLCEDLQRAFDVFQRSGASA